MSAAAAGFFGLGGGLLAAKAMGLPILGAFALGKLLPELVEFGFEFGDAAVA